MKKGGRIESFLELVQSEDDGESSFEEENDTDCGDEDETKREASRSKPVTWLFTRLSNMAKPSVYKMAT